MLVEVEKLALVGRDRLMKKLVDRMRSGRTFYLSGISGIGKTELLSYCYWECGAIRKIYIDVMELSTAEMVKEMARCQGIRLTVEKKRKTVAELQQEVLKGEQLYIFIDNFHLLRPKQCDYFLKMSRFCRLFLAIDEKHLKREEQKELIQGRERIVVNPIPKDARIDFAKYVLYKVRNREIDPQELAKSSRGIPRRFWNLARGEELYRNADDRIQEEEINISWILITILSVASTLRYFARGTGEKDLYILSAFAIGAAGLGKCFLREVNKK